MTQITEIDPDKKYVLVLSQTPYGRALQVLDTLRRFMADETQCLCIISGDDIAIVPADQIAGYKEI